MEHGTTPAGCKDERLFMCSNLYSAAFQGHIRKVTGLLQGISSHTLQAGHHHGHGPISRCSVEEVTGELNTLLHIAAEQGHSTLIAELCRWDSSLLSAVNRALDTPLHGAARAGHADAIEAIIRSAGGDNNLEEGRLHGFLCWRNDAGDMALHLAARHGHAGVVEKLVRLVPEMAAELDGAGVSPLYLAVMSRSVDTVRAIVTSEGDASVAGPDSQNALHAAVLQSSEMVSLLLRWRPELASNLDINKSSPLHFASSDGDCSIVKAILTHSAPSTAYLQDSDGLSALHAAARMGRVDAVRLLLQSFPACADIRDNDGKSFLHAAAMNGHSSVVSYAIKNRMLQHLLNTQDKEGNTLLHLAVVAGEHKVISKLLSSGKVQCHIMNNAGRTPFDLVQCSTGFSSMVRLVVKLYVSGAQFKPQRHDHIEKWNGQDIMKWREKISNNLAVVSTLVATVAFSAAFNVPGSYGSDGKANLSGDWLYDTFLVLDTIAVTTSVVATILLINGRASRSHRSWIGFMVSLHFLWLSLNSMMLGFFAAIVAVMSHKNPMNIALSQLIYYGLYVLITLLGILATPGSLIGILRYLVGNCFRRRRRAKRRIGRQFPFVMFYAINVVVFIVINIASLSAINVIGRLSAKK